MWNDNDTVGGSRRKEEVEGGKGRVGECGMIMTQWAVVGKGKSKTETDLRIVRIGNIPWKEGKGAAETLGSGERKRRGGERGGYVIGNP